MIKKEAPSLESGKGINNRKGYIMVFTAGVLWGTLGIFVKAMDSYGSSPALNSFSRVALALILTGLVTIRLRGLAAFRIDRRSLMYCALLGLVCQAVFNLLYNSSVSTIGMSISAVLLYVSPIFTTIVARFAFSERVTSWKVVALMVNLLGCTLTVTGGKIADLQLPLYGIALGVGAGFCYAMAAIIGRFATERADPLVVTTYSYLFATLSIGLLTRPWELITPDLAPGFYLVAFGNALIPTTVSYMLYYSALPLISETSKVPVIASVETAMAALIGVVLFSEPLGVINLLGIGLVLCSVALINKGTPTAKNPVLLREKATNQS